VLKKGFNLEMQVMVG